MPNFSAKLVIVLAKGGKMGLHALDPLLMRESNVEWKLDARISFMEIPRFRMDAKTAADWIYSIATRFPGATRVLITPELNHLSSLVYAVFKRNQDMTAISCRSSADMNAELVKALRYTGLSVEGVVGEFLDSWHPTSNCRREGRSRVYEWLDQFSNSINDRRQMRRLLSCVRLLREGDLAEKLDFASVAVITRKVFVNGGTTEYALRDMNRQRHFQEIISVDPESADFVADDLWPQGGNEAHLLTDWVLTGYQIACDLLGQSEEKTPSDQSLVRFLARNPTKRLILRSAITTRIAIRRMEWVAKNYLGENQLDFQYPEDDVLENLFAEPDFEQNPVYEPLVPEWELRAAKFLGHDELPRFVQTVVYLIEKYWPVHEYKDLHRKTSAGFCTFASYSVPESMVPLFARPSARYPDWFPLIVDALRPRDAKRPPQT
jgi:hypothetical protein